MIHHICLVIYIRISDMDFQLRCNTGLFKYHFHYVFQAPGSWSSHRLKSKCVRYLIVLWSITSKHEMLLIYISILRWWLHILSVILWLIKFYEPSNWNLDLSLKLLYDPGQISYRMNLRNTDINITRALLYTLYIILKIMQEIVLSLIHIEVHMRNIFHRNRTSILNCIVNL